MRIFIEGRGRKRNVEVGGRGREGACFADEAIGGRGRVGYRGGTSWVWVRKGWACPVWLLDHGQVSCRVCSAEDRSDGRKVMNLLGVEGKEV